MKKGILLTLIAIMTFVIINDAHSQDSTSSKPIIMQVQNLIVNKYAGLLVVYTSPKEDNFRVSKTHSFQIGIQTKTPVFGGPVFLETKGAFLLKNDYQETFGHAYFSYYSDRFFWTAGYRLRTTGYIKPNPIGHAGHFVPSALNYLPLNANGALIGTRIGSFVFKGGAYQNLKENKIGFDYGVDCFFSDITTITVAATHEQKKVTLGTWVDIGPKEKPYATWKTAYNDSIVTAFVEVNTKWCSPYINAVRDYDKKTNVTFEIGWTKTMPAGLGKSKLLIGYGVLPLKKERRHNLYIFAYIE